MSIEIRNVSKQFGDFQALRDVSLDIQSGELIALLGPSGCGKTTLLRIIAGLETPDVGSIHFSGEDTTDVHVRERNVGFVFQHYALFRHMTDRKSTRLNSSHLVISYAVFCLKKKKKLEQQIPPSTHGSSMIQHIVSLDRPSQQLATPSC